MRNFIVRKLRFVGLGIFSEIGTWLLICSRINAAETFPTGRFPTDPLTATPRLRFEAFQGTCGGTAIRFQAFEKPPRGLTVYGPPDCIACRAMEKEVGAGDERVAIKWVKDPAKFPPFVDAYARQPRVGSTIPNGWPVLHWQTSEGTAGRILSGRKSLAEIHKLLDP